MDATAHRAGVPSGAPSARLPLALAGPVARPVLLPLRAIQKESTELGAEETRVTSGSTEALNLTQQRKRSPIPTSLTALSLASASPPLGGHATPKLTSRSAAQDLDRMGVMTLVSIPGQLRSGPVIAGLCSGGWQGEAAWLHVLP